MARTTKKKATEVKLVCVIDGKTRRKAWFYDGVELTAELFRKLGPAKVEGALMAIEDTLLRDAIAQELRQEWQFWARPDQLLPDGEHRVILALAGRGWGKTRYGAQGVIEWKRQGFKYVNIIGPTYDDAWGVMVEGESGILAVAPADMRPTINQKKGLVWPDGSITRVFTAEEPERLRGKQHQKVWADELCAWRYPEAWDQMKFGLRLKAPKGAPVVCNQVLVTTTPKPSKLLRTLMADPQTHLIRGNTKANIANLSPDFYNDLNAKYAGTRLGRQELNAEVLDDNVGALWKLDQIDALRRYEVSEDGSILLPAMRRIVVAIDPAVTSNPDSDETGIIVAGIGEDGHGYVLEDGTAKERLSPDKWAKRAVRRFKKWDADRIIAEVNNGGDLVEVVIRAHDANVPYSAVRASRGKLTRAEPIAALYEQGRVHHCGHFPDLEDQMCEYNPLVDKKSPDRMDALVWALTELMLGDNNTGVLDWMEEEVKRLAAESGNPLTEYPPTPQEVEMTKRKERAAKKAAPQIEVQAPAPGPELTQAEKMRAAAKSFVQPTTAAAPLLSNGQSNRGGINSSSGLSSELDLIDQIFGVGSDDDADLDPEDED